MVEPDDFEVRRLGPDEPALFAQVFTLAERNKGRLGMLTHEAWSEYVASGLVLVAVRGGDLLGYAAFRLPRREVVLAHLCVDADARRRGVARALVEMLSRTYRDRNGIALRCRRDWVEASAAWPRLGFEVRSNKPGRSHDGQLLRAWWRDHGHADLFTHDTATSSRMVVAIDTNVFRDIHEVGRGEAANESRVLTADWLVDEVQLAVSSSTLLEIDGVQDSRLRAALLGSANSGTYQMLRPPLESDHDRISELHNAIVDNLAREELDADASLMADSRLVAEAIVGGADAFVSRDGNAVQQLRSAVAPLADLWISTPSDLIVQLDEAQDATSYYPQRLRDTGFTVAELGPGFEDALRPLLNTGGSERAVDHRRLIRDAAQRVGRSGARKVVRTPGGDAVAGWFFDETSSGLDVSYLRVAEGPLARTLAHHAVHLLRSHAAECGAERITITDRLLTPVVRSALLERGFVDDGSALVATVLTGVRQWRDVARLLGVNGIPVPSPRTIANLERIHWPLKVRDGGVRCFLVPIRPAAADALFGRKAGLWDSDAFLGLSRQHVYFRSPRQSSIDAPARILWYASSPEMQAVASSRLDQVVIDTPEHIYGRFKRLGILPLSKIRDQARDGRAMALRFGDTEFFTSSVPLARLLEIDSRLRPIPSPREIPEEIFFRVYEEGRGQ